MKRIKIKKIIRGLLFKFKTKNKFAPNILGKLYLSNRNIEIGKNVVIYNNVKFWGDGLISIGDNVKIGDNTMIYASAGENGGVVIKSNTSIAANCYFIDMDHSTAKNNIIQNSPNIVSSIIIGEDVWIGENVTVLKGSELSKGCIIGAKALVKGKFPEYSIAAGNPAKIIKYRE